MAKELTICPKTTLQEQPFEKSAAVGQYLSKKKKGERKRKKKKKKR